MHKEPELELYSDSYGTLSRSFCGQQRRGKGSDILGLSRPLLSFLRYLRTENSTQDTGIKETKCYFTLQTGLYKKILLFKDRAQGGLDLAHPPQDTTRLERHHKKSLVRVLMRLRQVGQSCS